MSLATFPKDFRGAVASGRDDRNPRRQRLDNDERKRVVERWMDQHIVAAIAVGHRFRRNGAGERDGAGQPVAGRRAAEPRDRPRPDDRERSPAAAREMDRKGFEKRSKSLEVEVVSDEEQP